MCDMAAASRKFGVLISVIIFAVIEAKPEMPFIVQGIDQCPTSLTYLEIQRRSRIQCAGACLQEYNCLGFCHNKGSEICRISKSHALEAKASAVASPGFIMYWPDYLDGYARYGHKAYIMSKTFLPFANASADCLQRDSYLVLPRNEIENQDLSQEMIKRIVAFSWVNIHFNAQNGSWKDNITGGPLTYMKWIAGYPTVLIYDKCAIVDISAHALEALCNVIFRYACEKLVYGSY